MDVENNVVSVCLHERLQWMSEQDLTTSQKSSIWLETRHSMITASDVHKCLSSEAQRNGLIRDKIHPKSLQVSASSLEHGNLFEPVARRFYEILRGCQTIQEYGCLRHRDIPFIGASPDGAVTDINSPYYGSLLEIKVPKSRELCLHERYIPIAYWEQMQIQMEVTELPCCDYLECKVGIFETQKDYEEYDSFEFYKGLLVHFRSPSGDDTYDVWIHQVNKEEDYDAFVLRKEREMRDQCTGLLIKILFWRIENYFLATVKRDIPWFTDFALPRVKNAWSEIEEGRKNPGTSKKQTTKKRPCKTGIVDDPVFPSEVESISNTTFEMDDNLSSKEPRSSSPMKIPVPLIFIDTSMCNEKA